LIQFILENFARRIHAAHGRQHQSACAQDRGPAWPVSAIVNGKRAITADTALRLAKYFGTSSELWLGLQSEYDLRVAKRTVGPEIEKRVQQHVA
jgi:plasmid maintenance system antidote protein VapI